MHLLILDDDAQIGSFLARAATGLGWTADVSTQPQEFQRLFADRRPDLIMLDLQLGASDGVEQLRFLHAARFTGPVVLISGFDERVLAAAERLGTSLGLTIAGAMHKPMRAADLRSLLQEIETRHAPISAAAVEEALNRGELRIDLQPVVDAADWRVHHLEALLRWTHPERGAIAPTAFLPAAEKDTAVMDRLTLWVVRQAVSAYQALQEDGLAVPVAVNVSGVNLHDVGFPDAVVGILAAAGLPPSTVLLEITETAATADPTAMLDILTRLRIKGIGVAIDDFGTGYSSLVALHRLPFTEIKIDRSFVMGVRKERESRAIVRSIVDLSRNLDLRTVAEGVEDKATAEALCELGVHCLQGYFFSRPLPRGEVAARLRSWPARDRGLIDAK